MKQQILLSLFIVFSVLSFGQGTTTSSISGKILDSNNGEALPGATIVAKHNPTGSVYGTVADKDGNYSLPNLRVGGPYTISITFIGYGQQDLSNVFLRLGEPQKRNFSLSEDATQLDAVEVITVLVGQGENAGASTQITEQDIDNMPTLSRSLYDYVKLTPQVDTRREGVSIAGMNNRFNAIYIDGAVNNDVFGLAGTGTNGGQTGISPFSIDIIDQIQVAISPFDVTLGGFAGGGINAVTKSGTNTYKGTAYYMLKNEKLAGKSPGELVDRGIITDRTRLDEFTEEVYGFSFGGPIKKDEVFFFFNVEIQDDITPVPFDFNTYEGNSTQAELDNLKNFLQTQYNYDAGSYLNKSDKLEGLKLFGKLDFNISENHKLMLRYQYTNAENTDVNSSASRTINFENNGEFFPSKTHSLAAELNSTFGSKFSNKLILGYTYVFDDRDPIGKDFPYLDIDDGSGNSIRLGSEQFSTANQVKQKIFTLTDNFKIYKGDHTLTIGTHNEFYDIYNLFIRQNYGVYEYNSVSDFMNNNAPDRFYRSYSLVDDIVGDGSKAAADFKAMQLGFYIQDSWQVNDKLNLTGGLRLDIPIITTDPEVDDNFNNTTVPLIQARYDLEGARAGQMPDGQLMLSPRIGFNYVLGNEKKSVLRGGVGIFTSRIPFVWPGGAFANNGLSIGNIFLSGSRASNVRFNPDINNQLTNPNFSIPSGQMDLFAKDFKYPQVFRTSLAFDTKLPGGIDATIEGIYTKTLNNVLYTNVNSNPDIDFRWAGVDNRPVYKGESIDRTYSSVYLASNTSEGYSYNITATFSKKFKNGLNLYLGYTYGDSESLNEGTSSQNSSQWRGQVHVEGRNKPVVGRSDFSLGHRIISSINYAFDWGKNKNFKTSFSLFYNGQSGRAYSYVYGSRSARNLLNETGSTSRNRTLIYIPNNKSDIVLVPTSNLTADQQWNMLNRFIEDDDYLSEHRGQYAEKNSNRTPFESVFDFKFMQEFKINVGKTSNRLQLTFDIFNVANFINKDWGVDYSTFVGSDNNYTILNFEGYDTDGQTPMFSFTEDKLGRGRFDVLSRSSRWRMRFGIRYIFN